VEERVLDASVSIRAAHAASPVHENAAPGSYAPPAVQRLGDIAVAKGYLTAAQLRQIVDLQERGAAMKRTASGGDPAHDGREEPGRS
jgi:hypothetical protein